MDSSISKRKADLTMLRTLLAATLGLGLILCVVQVATAGGAVIETTAPLLDRSDEGVKTAVVAALQKAVRGAAAMGFAWVELRNAGIGDHEVIVQIVATDEEPGEVTEVTPGAEAPDRDDGRPRQRELRRAPPYAEHI